MISLIYDITCKSSRYVDFWLLVVDTSFITAIFLEYCHDFWNIVRTTTVSISPKVFWFSRKFIEYCIMTILSCNCPGLSVTIHVAVFHSFSAILITCLTCIHVYNYMYTIMYTYICIPNVYLLYIYCIPTVYLLYTYCISTVYLLYTYCILTVYLLYTYCINQHVQYVR